MSKPATSAVSIALALAILTGCAPNPDAICVISREDGSGTRGAFVELVGVETEDDDGQQVDRTAAGAEITNSTAVMMLSVASDPAAIGYLSLGSLDDSVKAVAIDGVAPTTAGVADGSYAVSRTFGAVVSETPSPLTEEFMAFVLSSAGQGIVAETGFVPLPDAPPFTGGTATGKVVAAGSSSVAPVMEAIAEAYGELNPNAEIQIQLSDSTTGINAILEGIADVGLTSRELSATETAQPIRLIPVARDGIAVIVNPTNPVSELTLDQLRAIYTGELTAWSEVRR